MKKNILLLILFNSIIVLNAQNYSEGIPTEYVFSSGKQAVIQMRFDKVSKKNVKKAISNIFKTYKSKVSSVKDVEDEYQISDFKLESNQKTATSIMKIVETNGNVTLYSFFKTQESVVSEELTPNDVTHYKNLMKLIANKAVSIEYDDAISLQKKKVKDEEKKLSKLKKQEDDEHKNISKNELSIKNSKQLITQLNTSLSSQEVLVMKNNELIKAKETEIAAKSVKSLNSKISELQKENKSHLKTISKHKNEIAEIKGEIAILNSSLKGNETEKATLKSSENIDKKSRKKLKSLNKEGLNLIGEIEKNKVSVANEESTISAIETEIKNNQTEIALLQAEITEHNEDALNEQLKLLEKDSKKLNQKKKSLENDLKNENESINEKHEKIKTSQDKIKEFKAQQDKQATKIDESKKTFKALEDAKKKFE